MTPLELTQMECLLMCALLCSTDVIAAISIIEYEEQPKLYSLLFGEGVVNDAVSIILFNSVHKYAHSEFTAMTGFAIFWDFVKLSSCSLIVGILVAIIPTLLLKHFRVLAREALSECIVLFSFAYLAYILAEIIKQSGIIALLTCGITMASYCWYNLSP